jgi:hypothetical protein
MEFAFFVSDYVSPVAVTIMFVLMVYIFVTEALTARRRAKREREQQIH